MRILVVDGHPAMQLGIEGLLGVAGDMRVIGESGDGYQAFSLAEEPRANLLILGLDLVENTDGAEVCRGLKAFPLRVLMHAAYNFTDDVWYCLLAGVDSYLHKRSGCVELLDAARRAAAGEGVWSLGERIEELRSGGVAASRGDRLTPRSVTSWL